MIRTGGDRAAVQPDRAAVAPRMTRTNAATADQPLPPDRFSLREHAAWALAVPLAFAAGYFGIATRFDAARATTLLTPLDAAIPFVPQAIFVYVVVYPLALYPLFVIRSLELLRRTICAYAIVMVVSLGCYVLLPVTAAELRSGVGVLDPTRFDTWGVKLLFTLDPPSNLFPSLHVAMATLAGLAALRAHRGYGVLALVAVAGIAVATVLVRQHFLLDVAAGMGLAIAAHAAVIRPLRLPSAARPSFTWRGPAAWVVLVAAVYLSAYALFRLGAPVWTSMLRR
jgi:membrane-associated phospholipid phosphatase